MLKTFSTALTLITIIIVPTSNNTLALDDRDASSVQTRETKVIDFKLGSRGHIIVPVNINGIQKNFILDTGASKTALHKNRVGDLDLNESEYIPIKINRAHTVEDSFLVSVDVFEMAGLIDTTIKPALMDLTDFDQERIRIDGIVGFDFFGNYDLSINYPERQLTLNKQIKGEECDAVAGVDFDLLHGASIKFDSTISGKTIPTILDTGSWATGMNGEAANSLIPNVTKQLKANKSNHKPQHSHGDSNPLLGQLQLDQIIVGEVIIAEAQPVNVVDLPVFKIFGMENKPGMILGANILKNRTLNISYGCKRLDIH